VTVQLETQLFVKLESEHGRLERLSHYEFYVFCVCVCTCVRGSCVLWARYFGAMANPIKQSLSP